VEIHGALLNKLIIGTRKRAYTLPLLYY